jgi:hypothetical protein
VILDKGKEYLVRGTNTMLRFFKSKDDIDDVTFYFEADQLGVSDNHRMAYWFFVRKATPGSTLIHVDTHTDCSYFRDSNRAELNKTPSLDSIDQFVKHRYPDDGKPRSPVREGNWIPALLDMHPHLLKRVFLICHKKDASINADYPCVEERGEEWLRSPNGLDATNACLSIDVDYYFTLSDSEYRQRSVHPDPTHHFQWLLRHGCSHSREPLFIALSPGCCGGWDNVLPFVNCIDQTFNLTLREKIEGHF